MGRFQLLITGQIVHDCEREGSAAVLSLDSSDGRRATMFGKDMVDVGNIRKEMFAGLSQSSSTFLKEAMLGALWIDSSPLHSDAVQIAELDSKLIIFARSQRTHAARVEHVEPEKLLASIFENKNPHRMAGDELAFDETMIVTIDTRDGREDRAFFSAGYSDYPVGAVTEKDRIFVYGSRARVPRILELRAH